MLHRLTVLPSHRLISFLTLLTVIVSTAAVLSGAAGCTAWATYPPIPGAAQIGRPEFEPVPTVMAEAIRFTHDRHGETMGMGETIIFNLPEGTSPNTYERVIHRLGRGVRARWMTEEDPRAIHITSVRVRATEAQVDVVYPRPDGHHELIMLSMSRRFPNRYVVEASRLWRIRVTAPPPHYYPPGAREERAVGAQPDAHALAEEK